MKKIVISVLLLAIVVGIGYRYLYKDHRNIAAEEAYAVEAVVLSEAFRNTPDEAQTQYLDKTLKVSGKITQIEVGAISMTGGIYCEFAAMPDPSPVAAQEITIKGRCIGYDELLDIVKLDQCSLIN